MTFALSYNSNSVTLTLKSQPPGMLQRLLGRTKATDLSSLSSSDRALAFALADLRALHDETGGSLTVADNQITMDHELAAALDAETAGVLELPPVVDLVLRTDAEGLIGSSNFQLSHQWLKNGRKQMPKRVGCILQTEDGDRRLPAWLLEAVEVAEQFRPGSDEAAHWEALARFRRALDPGIQIAIDSQAGRISMTDFLQGLEVRLADRFSIAPRETVEGLDFDIVPFSGRRLEADVSVGQEVAESQGELSGSRLSQFQQRVRTQGTLPAYRVGDGQYLVIDRSAKPVLKAMETMLHAAPEERDAFVRNPRPRISQAVEEALRAAGKLDNLSAAGEEEAVEALAGPALVETQEYSDRVTGITVYRKPELDLLVASGTTWLPEYFTSTISEKLKAIDSQQLQGVCDTVRTALEAGHPTVELEGETLQVAPEALHALELTKEARLQEERAEKKDKKSEDDRPVLDGPIIVDTKDNFEELKWRPQRGPRSTRMANEIPPGISTLLREHQTESLNWQVSAWSAGLPGVLNADEQGLGKTLQTIAFLKWLQLHMADPTAEHRGPILVVAPTSLLENWEAEVERHLDHPGLGHLIRLYGSSLSQYKRRGGQGVDTKTGEEQLQFDLLHEAIAEGRGHRFWMLTTYTTLTNYQHSLARIPFSAVVFDEIQALKNPVSLRAVAARAVQADFRIGLTGTPIENTTTDLWAIMDQLCAGPLGSLREFRAAYGTAAEENMAELHQRVFLPNGDIPALAIRRLKEDVARDLPSKTRKLHPRAMPEHQAKVYEEARVKLAEGSRGAALKMLHHIRSVSVHPALDSAERDDSFITASGRLDAAFDILRRIRSRGERALVFIEHRKMQYRFIELARQEFGLDHIDLINGDTPIQKRQIIVHRFQNHLEEDRGFDLLVLGPKAAGTGLTLTAATHVIHLSRWWNPAVEEQCNDRVHRLGQTSPVTIHVPMAIHPGYRDHSFDCLLHSLMTRKRRLASSALWPMGDTSEDAAELQKMVAEEHSATNGDPVAAAMEAMFARDNCPLPPFAPDGSLTFG